MNNSCGEPVTIRFMDLHRNCIELAVIVFGYIFPILSLLVTTMNILIVIVFVKPHMRSQTTFILTLIACVDIVNIACPATVFAYLYLRGHFQEYLTCGQIQWSYVLGKICVDMLNMISLWLTVLLAFIRCRHISSPFIARQEHSSYRKIIIYVIIIAVFVSLVHVPSFYIFEFQSVTNVDPITNLTNVIGALVETESVYFNSCSGRKLHIIVETLTDSVIPCVILVCCNIKILIMLRKAKKNRLSMRRKDMRFTNNDENRQDNIRSETGQRKTLNHGTTNKTFETEDVYDIERCIPSISKSRSQDNKCKPKDIDNSENPKYSLFKRVKLHNFCSFKFWHVSARIRSDTTLDKLDRRSERTSWLIFLVSTIIIVHEFPLAVLNSYTLATYNDKPLPLSHGCYSIIILLLQFVTYPAIFLIYACMCKAFRKELWKLLTCVCRLDKCKQ